MRQRHVVASLAVIVTMLAAALGQAQASAEVQPDERIRPHGNEIISNALTGVSALSPTDVWVVGNRPTSRNPYQPVIRRFDGQRWTRVGTLRLGGASVYPTSIEALADDDVWVSLSSFDGTPSRVAHWDGQQWTTTALSSDAAIYHVWADSGVEAWAVGAESVVEHFDGRGWTPVTTPAPAGSTFFGVSGSGPDDVWLAGRCTGQQNYELLLMHWDGHAWTKKRGFGQPGYTGLESVEVLSPTDAWAAGWLNDPGSGTSRGLLLHWNGRHWTDSYVKKLHGAYLHGVSAASAASVWTAGSASGKPVSAHWDGHTWTTVQPRSPGSEANILLAVSADSETDAWAVGFREEPSSRRHLIEHFDGNRWVVVQP